MRIIRLSAIRLALTTDPAGSTGTVTTNEQPTFTPLGPGLYAKLEESQLPARELGLQLHSVEVGSVDEYESSIQRSS